MQTGTTKNVKTEEKPCSNQLVLTVNCITNLVLSGHGGQVVLQPPVLSDCDVFVSPESCQLFLRGIKLPPQAGYLPLTAV